MILKSNSAELWPFFRKKEEISKSPLFSQKMAKAPQSSILKSRLALESTTLLTGDPVSKNVKTSPTAGV